jgi:WD repeat and SOF domain-containing protein 1
MTLPTHSSAVEEKLERQHRASGSFSSWTRPVSLPIPGVRSRRLRILLPSAVAGSFNSLRMSRMRRKRGPVFVAVVCIAVCFAFVLLAKAVLRRSRRGDWDTPSGDPSTLVFKREDLQKIWKWEIESGHYPSLQPRMYLPLCLSFHCR